MLLLELVCSRYWGMKVRKQLLLLGLLPAVALLYSCAEEPPPRPVVEVVVDEVVLEPYRPQSEYVGRLLARDDVTIEARISGYLLTRDFREGEV